MSKRVFVVAAEASGDALGAELIDALRDADSALVFAGIGGAQMAARGVDSVFDISELSVLGLVEGLMAYDRVVKRADQAADAILRFDPDVVVLIDSWGFMLRVAQRVRARGARARLVKYIGPQVWATRAGRAKTLAGAVDHLICIHDFETPYYARFGLPCTVCGHPAFGRFVQGDGAAFRARHALGDAPTLLLLLGSRRSELRRTGPQILAAADIVALRAPGVKLVAVAASHVAAQARDMCKGRPILVVDEATEKNDAFNAATAAIATSGTVTTEIGLQGTPVVVGYRLGWITWAIARFILLKAKFATLMNVAADDEAAPEFLQTRCTPENLAAAAFPLLTDPAKRQAQVAAQFAALEKMGRGGPPAAKIAAGAVLAEMSKVQA